MIDDCRVDSGWVNESTLPVAGYESTRTHRENDVVAYRPGPNNLLRLALPSPPSTRSTRYRWRRPVRS